MTVSRVQQQSSKDSQRENGTANGISKLQQLAKDSPFIELGTPIDRYELVKLVVMLPVVLLKVSTPPKDTIKCDELLRVECSMPAQVLRMWPLGWSWATCRRPLFDPTDHHLQQPPPVGNARVTLLDFVTDTLVMALRLVQVLLLIPIIVIAWIVLRLLLVGHMKQTPMHPLR